MSEQNQEFGNDSTVIDMMRPDYFSDIEDHKKLVAKAQQAIKLTEKYLSQLAAKHGWMDQDVPSERFLKLKNGMIVKCLRDLNTILQFIDNDTFLFHVSPQKNDFADWVFATYKNKDLAISIRKSKDRQEIISVIENMK